MNILDELASERAVYKAYFISINSQCHLKRIKDEGDRVYSSEFIIAQFVYLVSPLQSCYHQQRKIKQ